MYESNGNPSRPGPKGHPLLGIAMDFRRDPTGTFFRLEKQYPDISFFRFSYLKMVFLTKPDYIKHVLATNNKSYHKGIEYEQLKLTLGEGLLTSEGSFWLRQRRLSQPSFHRKKIALFVDTMVNSTQELLNDWATRDQEKLDVLPEMMKVTLDVIGKTMFSSQVKSQAEVVENALGVLVEDAFRRIQAMLRVPLWIPTPNNRQTRKAITNLDKVIFALIDQRRATGESQDDLLSMLMEAEDADTGERMSDMQLRDEAMTIFIAGHETTANVLTWALYLMAKNPAVQEKLVAEVDAVLQGKPPTMEHTTQLDYTRMVLEETMRLYPPAWAIGRKAIEDDTIGGYKINKGDNILICPLATHRSEQFWDQPLAFRPERFSKAAAKERHRFEYFPFGGGPRLCIGNNFAMLEMQIILTMLVQRYRFRHCEGHRVEMAPLVTLRPKYGMEMQLERRK